MTIIDFAERVSPIPLNKFQIELLRMYDEAEKQGMSLHVIPPRCGKGIVKRIVDEWNEEKLKTAGITAPTGTKQHRK